MSDLLIPAVVIGGVTYALVKQGGTYTPPGHINYQTPSSGSTLGNIGSVPNGGYTYDPYLDPSGQAGFNLDGRLTDPDARQKLDLLDSAMQVAYSKLDAAGRATAADQLNQKLNLEPPLNGNETWETVARVAGGAGGFAACNAIPGIGTAVSPLCSMAGAYLGVRLEEWMASELPGLKTWVNDNIGNVLQSIGDQIDEWWHDIF